MLTVGINFGIRYDMVTSTVLRKKKKRRRATKIRKLSQTSAKHSRKKVYQFLFELSCIQCDVFHLSPTVHQLVKI